MIDILASPNDVARELTGRDYLSYSSISTFQACPLKWHFRYVQQLPEATVSANLVFGGAIHSAAEHHYREVLAGNPAPDLDTLLDVYQTAWNDRDQSMVKFAKGDNIDTLGSLAERMLTAFQTSKFAKPQGSIVGVEEELRGSVVPGCPDLLARVDLIVEESDAVVVTDLKTARSRWSQGQVEGSAEQLLLYNELAGRLLPEKPVRLEFVVVTKTKEPVVENHIVAIDDQRLERTRVVVQRVWQAIEGRNFYPAPSPMQCPGCGFREMCRTWGE